MLLLSLPGCGGPAPHGELGPGDRVERRLAAGGMHRFPLPLARGEFLHLRARQEGVDLAFSLRDPAGAVVAERNAPTTSHGPEPLSVIAVRPGVHTLEIKAAAVPAVKTEYSLEVLERRPARPDDAKRIEAEEMLTAAGPLHWENTEVSLREASRLYHGALDRFRELGAKSEEAYVLLNLGEVDSDLDTPYLGLENLEQALEIFRGLGDLTGEAETLSSTGFIYTFLGEKQKALDFFRRALDMRSLAGDLWGQAHSYYQIARLYQSMDEPAAALRYFQSSLAMQRRLGDRAGEGFCLTALADVYESLGRLEEAFASLEKALELHQDTRDSGAIARVYSQMGSLHATSGDPERALAAYRLALPILRSLGSRGEEALTSIRIASAEESLGALDEALETYREALDRGRVAHLRGVQAEALYGIARVLRRRGSLEESREHIGRALDLVEALRTEVTADRLRSSFLASRRPHYEFAVDLLMEMEAEEPGRGHLEEAIRISEQARARGLLDILQETRTDIRQGVSPRLLARESELQSRLNDLAAEQERLLASPGGGDRLARIEEELEALLGSYRELQAEIRDESPRYAALTQPRPLSVEQIRREVVDPSTRLLVFALGEERSFLWAIGSGGVESFSLPGRAELERKVRAFYELVTARNRRPRFETAVERRERLERAAVELPAVAEELGQLLFGDLAPRLEAEPEVRRLALVAEGALQYLPFAALPWPASSRPVSLVERFELVRLPSASTLAVLRRELGGREEAEGVLAVLADPVFSPEDPRLRSAPGGLRAAAGEGLPSIALRYPRLPFTRGEAEAILELAPPEGRLARMGFDASREAMTDPRLGEYRILHFATHALLNSEHPELSGIVLSLVDRSGRQQDGFLRLHEIYNLELSAELVVLAACRTALGEEVRGEGLVGLTRGFMYAGAPRVVATLWDVDDEASAELMRRFYQALLVEGRRPAAALRAVQASMAREERWRDPFYWAAFVLQGEWL